MNLNIIKNIKTSRELNKRIKFTTALCRDLNLQSNDEFKNELEKLNLAIANKRKGALQNSAKLVVPALVTTGCLMVALVGGINQNLILLIIGAISARIGLEYTQKTYDKHDMSKNTALAVEEIEQQLDVLNNLNKKETIKSM